VDPLADLWAPLLDSRMERGEDAMEWLGNLWSGIIAWMKDYSFEISVALIATIMGMFSNDLNKHFRKRLRSVGFAFRFGVFVMLTAFGYGMVTIALAKFLQGVLKSMDGWVLVIVVILSFLGLALLAERRNQV
jgi:nitrate reductase gamma subunit